MVLLTICDCAQAGHDNQTNAEKMNKQVVDLPQVYSDL